MRARCLKRDCRLSVWLTATLRWIWTSLAVAALKSCVPLSCEITMSYRNGRRSRKRPRSGSHCEPFQGSCFRGYVSRAKRHEREVRRSSVTLPESGRVLRDLPGHRQTRSQELLLFFRSLASNSPQCDLRDLCVYAQGRRPL